MAVPDEDDDPADPTGATSELDASRLTHLVGYAASRARLRMRKVFAQHMAPLDLKVIEFSILMLVVQNPRVNQKQLGHALDVSPPNMAVTLDRMVERGWVERVRSTADRRAQNIHLTHEGRVLVAKFLGLGDGRRLIGQVKPCCECRRVGGILELRLHEHEITAVNAKGDHAQEHNHQYRRQDKRGGAHRRHRLGVRAGYVPLHIR